MVQSKSYPYIGGATVGNAYLFTRYMGNPELTTSVPNSRHLVKPFLLPEMYLINAEANAKAGKTTDAVTILNQLQNARGAQTQVQVLTRLVTNGSVKWLVKDNVSYS